MTIPLKVGQLKWEKALDELPPVTVDLWDVGSNNCAWTGLLLL